VLVLASSGRRVRENQLPVVVAVADHILGPAIRGAAEKHVAGPDAGLGRTRPGVGLVAVRWLERDADELAFGLATKRLAPLAAAAVFGPALACAARAGRPRFPPSVTPGDEDPTGLGAGVEGVAGRVVAGAPAGRRAGVGIREGPTPQKGWRIVAAAGERGQGKEPDRRKKQPEEPKDGSPGTLAMDARRRGSAAAVRAVLLVSGSEETHALGYRTLRPVRVECRVMRRSQVFFAGLLLPALSFLGGCKTTSSSTPAPATAASSAESAPPTPAGPATDAAPGSAATGSPAASGPPGSVTTPPSGSAMVNGGTEVSGERTLADIARIITTNRDKFRHCYDQAQQVNQALKGKYVVVFELSPSGELKTAKIDENASEIRDKGMDTCTITELQKLTFPRSLQGKETKVSYPFTFTPGGGGPAKTK
jgi:hypothetical protein